MVHDMIHPFTDFFLPIWWAISALLPVYYWLLFGATSKYEGIGLRFFETRTKTFISSEGIGILGTLVNLILVPEDALLILLMPIFMIPLFIITTYGGHELRHTIEDQQSKKKTDDQPNIHNEDSIS